MSQAPTPEEISRHIYTPSVSGKLRQGEILSNITQIILSPADDEGNFPAEEMVHPYCIVVSQDCDLEQDFNNRFEHVNQSKQIPTVLLCYVSTAEELRDAENSLKGRRDWEIVAGNNNKRYHFFNACTQHFDAVNQGLPELAVDFKRFFTIETHYLYSEITSNPNLRRTVLKSPYLEHFSQRFASYMSRIGLPFNHTSEP